MFPKLKISIFAMKRLEKVKQQCSGCLFGLIYEGTLLILGFNVESTIGKLNYKQIQHKFPAEVDLCGLVKFGDCSDAEAHMSEILQDVDITDNPILLHCALGTLVDLKASLFMHGKLQEIPYEVVSEEELYRDFCFTRLQCSIDVLTDESSDSIKKDMQALRKELGGGSLAFYVPNTNIYLTGVSSGICSASIATKISDILTAVNGDPVKPKKAQKPPPTAVDYEVINVKVLRNRCKDVSEKPGASMKCVFKQNDAKLCIPIEVDAMAMLYKNTRLMGLYDILIESICRSLRLTEQSLVDRVLSCEQLTHPKTYHFAVPDFGHFLSCVYLENIPEDDSYIQQKRKKLHHHFSLPIHRPYFRKANKYAFKDDLLKLPPVNPHIGAKPSNLKEGKQYLVQGRYTYYHYMQQNFDDNGWGCAYRSLQSLCSWFRWQGYTDRLVPTHKEIQEYLVKVGDKPKNFIGSRQWIGSTEVAMCLSGFLKVDSKILHVTSGADLATKGSDLVMHFETQGTPVMIGGGVLAHTILGVDYNSITGEVKFLILDPHFTESDDLHVIHAKGWCGWKGTDFWDKKSYYNLCMPQRPIIY